MSKISKNKSQTKKIRYALLDEIRGFMVLCMVFYHGFLTVYNLLELPVSLRLFEFFTPIEPLFAAGFIILSGLMCGFSRSNIKRGALLSAFSVLLTIVTAVASNYVGDMTIYFGILHLLGVSMLFCGVFNFILKRVNKYIGLILSLAAAVITYGFFDSNLDLLGITNLLPVSVYKNPYLFPLGITTAEFSSADYFPILPWLFVFLFGYYLYKFEFVQRHSKLFKPKRIKPLGFLGRHALIIYVVHQPIIYALCYLTLLFMR